MKLSFASLVVLAACSSDPLAPGAGSDPGSGTNSLSVEGRASAEPTTPNAKNKADFRTDFSVRIQLGGQNVTTGTVTLKSQVATTPLTLNGGNNRWEGTASGYDEVYQLDIVSGADKVQGVIVDGPDIHFFTAPSAGASLDSTIANDVKWDRGEEADLCTITTEHLDRLTIADTGTYSMPAGSLKAEKDKTSENTIEIRRTNQVVPAGALGGSTFSVSISNTIDVVAQPNPAL